MNRKPLLKATKKIKEDPLGDNELNKILDNPKIMKYSELSNYNNIEDILPYDYSYVILLWEQVPNIGHWTALLRYGDIIEYYDSYGKPLEFPLNYSKDNNAYLNQYPNLLKRLLNKAPFKIIYNSKQVQSDNLNIKTCGRHIANRIKFLLNYGYDLNKYNKLLDETKKRLKTSYDDIVSYLIDHYE